jgi:UDP-glucose 4-epimerase
MILVTGAGGFVGSNLVSHLVSSQFDVLPLYHSDQVSTRNNQWEADLTREDHIEELKRTKRNFNSVVHLAGYVEIALRANKQDPYAAPIPGKENISRIYMCNVGITANVLDLCLGLGVEHIVFASSQTIYGMPTTGAFTEDSPYAPLEHYANSKVCCERLLQVGSRQGISVTMLRFPGVYSEKRQNGVVYEFCKDAVFEKRIIVNAELPLPLDVIHLDDVLNALKRAVQHNRKAGWLSLNIATGEPCSLNLLADAVAELVPGCVVEYSEVPQPIVEMDPSRAYEVLGWRAEPREERLAVMVEHVRDN